MPVVLPPNEATERAESTGRAEQAARGEGKREYVQQMFSDIAPRYDLLNHVLSMNIDKAWRRKALRALQWTRRPAGCYLDLCAGTLDVGAALVKQPGFAGFVAGADFAVPMLRHGNGKASREVLAPVGADALALPFAGASLDGAIVAFGIRNVPRIDQALREARRVLKRGGRFLCLEFSMVDVPVLDRFYATDGPGRDPAADIDETTEC
jgi:demethylmenaquinone methyltransferase/2-methoxy-6-polyprenyl-1,4-benzoquinol methylase